MKIKEQPKNRFYVYAYLDPRKPGQYTYGEYIFNYEPFYVGKGGTPRQIKRHLFESVSKGHNPLKTNKIKKIISLNFHPIIIKIKDTITEQEAFILEHKLITTIGRIDLKKGPLTNLVDGFYGGKANPSEEVRKKLGKATKGKTYEEIYGNEKAKELKKSRIESNNKRTLSKKSKNKISNSNSKNWKITNPDGKVFLIKNLNQFCKNNNLQTSNMHSVFTGKQKHHKGWKCESI